MKLTSVLTGIAIIAAALIWSPCFAVELVVSADVPVNSPTLTTTILKFSDGDPDGNPWTNSSQEQTIDFGQLTYKLADNSNAGSFYSSTGYCVILTVEPFGKPFNILATCSGVTDSGGHSLPVGSFGMIPVYSKNDKWKYSGGEVEQGDLPAGAVLGTSGPAVPGRTVYSSETSTATARMIQLYLSIPPLKAGGAVPFDGYVPVPLTQSPGKYSSTVTLTLSPK